MRAKGILIYFIYSLLLSMPIKGEAEEQFVQREIYSLQNGFASNTVNFIEQDREGYLYFCTNRGLSIFDGNLFQHFNAQNRPGLSNNLSTLVVLDERYLLLGSQDKGLFVFDKYKDNLSAVEGYNATIQGVNTLLKTSKGEIWFGGEMGDLWYVSDYRKLLDKSEKTIFHRIAYSFSSINALIEVDGTLLVATQSNQLLEVKRNQATVTVEKVASTSIESMHSFLLKSKNELWVGMNHGIAIFQKNEKHWEATASIAREIGRVRSMAVSGGKIYAGTEGNGVFEINPQTAEYSALHQDRYSLAKENQHYVLALKSGLSGDLWIGTWLGGAARLMTSSPLFRLHENNESNPNQFPNIVWEMCQTQTDSLLMVATHEGGLCRYESKSQRIRTLDMTYPSISSLYADSLSPNLYVGTWGHGLQRYDLNRSVYLPQKIGRDIENERVYALARHTKEQLLVGTGTKGVWIYHEKTHQLDPLCFPGDSFPSLNVRAIKRDEEGRGYWFATFNAGVLHVDFDASGIMKTLLHLPHAEQEAMQATDILQVGDFVWICTTNGLACWNRKKSQEGVKRFPQFEGHYLSGIEQDYQGNLWISSYEGLFFFNPKHPYVTHHLANRVNYRIRSIDENLWVGSLKGLISFDPAKVREGQQQGRALIRSLQKDGKTVTTNPANENFYLKAAINYIDTLSLPAGSENINFQLSALSLHAGGVKELYYCMEGLESYWTKCAHSNFSAPYSNIPAGIYRFRVRLNNPENQQGERSMWVVKEEFWWRTKFAKACYLFVCVAIIALSLFLLNKRSRRRYTRRLEEIERQKEEELYLQKIRFFTNISHDLKTPLTLLLTPLSDLIKHPDMPTPFRVRLRSMHSNGELLLKKINKILNYRNTEGQNTSLSLQVYDLSQLCYEIVTPFQEYAERQGLIFQISTDITPEQKVVIQTDREKLESLLENLISNAIKYTPEGGRVLVNFKLHDQQIAISIADSGRGIPTEALPHIFNPYFRIATDNRGTGIGLFLVKHYVDMLNGEIKVTSELEKGTIFDLSLPLWQEEVAGRSQEREEAEESSLASNADNPIRILIVDDNKEVREYLRQLFTPTYCVEEARNGKQALESVQSNMPDIIISDLMMDEMDGIALCRTLKQNMQTSHIPFIVLTAKDSTESRLECWNVGVDLFEAKPFNSQLLQTKVASLLRSRQLLRYKYQIIAAPLQNTSSKEEGKAESLEERFLREVNEFIDKNKDKPDLSIRELGEELNMRHDQLYRKLKVLTGLSANQYIRTYRLNCAAAMLRSRKYMVTEVLYSVGFNNPSYFTKCFKKEFGVLPSEYVEQMVDQKSESSLRCDNLKNTFGE